MEKIPEPSKAMKKFDEHKAKEKAKKDTGLIATMAKQYNLDPKTFKATIMAAAVGGGKNMDMLSLAQLLLVANEYNLNPVTKEIYAFPSRNGLQPLVGIDGWIKLANRHPEFDGIQTEVVNDKDGNMIGMTATVWRKDRSHPVVETEFLSECRKNTDLWKRMPNRMMKHRAKAQAIRTAFGFAGIYLPDEFTYDEKVVDAVVVDQEVKGAEAIKQKLINKGDQDVPKEKNIKKAS